MEYTIEDHKGVQVTPRVRYFLVPQFTNYPRLIYPKVMITVEGHKSTLKSHSNVEEPDIYAKLLIKEDQSG